MERWLLMFFGFVIILVTCTLFAPDRAEQARQALEQITTQEAPTDDAVQALFSEQLLGNRSSETDARVVRVGLPCTGKVGVAPYIFPRSLPRIGRRFVMQFVTGLKPAGEEDRQFWVLIGGQDQQWGEIQLPLDLTPAGMPGCILRVPGDIVYALPAGSNTVAGIFRREERSTEVLLDVVIPNAEQLVGARLFMQAVVGADGEFLLTQAYMVQIGR